MLIWTLIIGHTYAEDTELVHELPWEDYLLYGCVSLGLVLFAGLMSGLTVGMMSIDELFLEMKLANGTDLEKKQARALLPILNRHHLLLVTLLIANSLASEALPIMLDEMFGSVIAVLLSVTFVFIFGEVLPQALCTGPNQLQIAYKLINLVKVVIVIFFPITYPISKLLDKILGSSEVRYKQEDLKALVTMIGDGREAEERKSIGLGRVQIRMIHGAIDLQNEIVSDHMISIEDAFHLMETDVISDDLLGIIVEKKFTNIPVYSDQKIIGILKPKCLLGIDRNLTLKESGVGLAPIVQIYEHISVLDLLGILKSYETDFAVVINENDEVRGIITMEVVVNKVMKIDSDDDTNTDIINRISSRRNDLKEPLL